MATFLKLENEMGQNKKIKYPKSFDELIKAVKEFVPSLDNNKRYQLIEGKNGKEIATQQNFETMTKEYLNEAFNMFSNITRFRDTVRVRLGIRQYLRTPGHVLPSPDH